MKLKDFRVAVVFLLGTVFSFSQSVRFVVIDSENNLPIEDVQVIQNSKFIGLTNENGEITLTINPGEYVFTFNKFDYLLKKQDVKIDKQGLTQNIFLDRSVEELTEVALFAKKKENFELTNLKPVEETHIYAGKKSEVVNLDLVTGSKSTNNARQIYAKVAGLNIYDNSDGGLQLNIGGRGLDPNRTANFNTRQNDYDISADVLGYPESYYTPPAEAIDQIQVVRGAASLQYGTQFGGLINFKLKKPNKNKPFNFLTRNTAGSFGTLTNFTSIDGTKGKLSYLGYTNFKKGDGFRANSQYNSRNFYGYLNYDFNDKTSLSLESTNFYYLAKQSGGLSDAQFLQDPYQSYRERNWFQVDWKLYNALLKHQFTDKTKATLSLFALNATRKAIGFRTNPDDENANIFDVNSDEQDFNGNYEFERDLLVGEFNNYGLETRVLHEYNLKNQSSFFLFGTKYYKANNNSKQGAGSKDVDADFNFYNEEFWDYPNQSNFTLPNQNISLFTENLFNISETLSITPGLRFEYIKTESVGSALDPLSTANGKDGLFFVSGEDIKERSFLLAGIGIAYKPSKKLDIYANASQNYRSVTFSDINSVTPAFTVDPNIVDATGFTFDVGARGHYNKKMSYDVSVFSLLYDNRIGLGLNDRAQWVSTNIGKAVIVGLESLIQWNVKETFFKNHDQWQLDVFSNFSVITSEYTESELNNVKGNEVEFIPDVTLKTGINVGYHNLLLALQYSYTGKQFTDATNSAYNPNNTQFVQGAIPAYDILDFSTSYKFNKKFKLEGGINNVLNNAYFTRRATGYPGPGIIPAEPRYYYVTLEFKI